MPKKPATKPKRGRPRSPLTATIPRIRVDPADLKAWMKIAASEGRTLSGWIRHACNTRMDEWENGR